MTRSKQNSFLFTGLLALLTVVYWHALRIPYFGDDFQWFFPKPSDMLFGNFIHRAPDNTWYRPLQSMVLAFIQMVWGADTLPIRIVHLSLQASMGVLIFRVLQYWKVSFASSFIAALYFAVTQACVYPVIANDMVSQMMGSLFGALTIWNLYRGMEYVREGKKFPISRLAISLLTFFLALVSKETSAGLCLSVVVLIYIMQPKQEMAIGKFRNSAIAIIPFFLLGVVYTILRSSAGAAMPTYGGEGSYQMHFGFNILKNFGLFLFQSVLPFSSTLLAHMFYDRNLVAIAILVGGTAMLGVAWIYGIWKSPKRRLIVTVLCFGLLSLIPALFLNHVSESYLYNALPYLMVALGFAIDYYRTQASASIRFSFAILLLIALVANVAGDIQKTNAMAEESSRSQIIMDQLYPIIPKLPPNGVLYLVNPVTHEFEYSVFAMKGLRVVEFADPWIVRHTHRPDVSMFVLDSAEYRDSSAVHPGAAYTLDMKSLRLKEY